MHRNGDTLNPGRYYLSPPEDWKSFGFYVRCVKLGTNFPVFQSVADAFANKDHQISLVLDGEKIMSFDSIFACKKMKRLQLSSCKIEILPDKFDQLTELTYLDLSSNKFKTLPPSFSKLKKLEYLDLEYCFDLKIDFKILQQLTNCKYMKIPKDYSNESYYIDQVNQLKRILPNCKIEH
jgi:Leucine-rich repeat (LRR) protein